MANHKSAEKRIRANETKRVRNRYQAKTTRTQVKKLVTTTKKDEAQALLKEVSSMIDKLAKKNIIHWKKAANQKSKLAKIKTTATAACARLAASEMADSDNSGTRRASP